MLRVGLTEKMSEDVKTVRILAKGVPGARAFQVVGTAKATIPLMGSRQSREASLTGGDRRDTGSNRIYVLLYHPQGDNDMPLHVYVHVCVCACLCVFVRVASISPQSTAYLPNLCIFVR